MSFWYTWLQVQNVLLCPEFSSILFGTRQNWDWISFYPTCFSSNCAICFVPCCLVSHLVIISLWKKHVGSVNLLNPLTVCFFVCALASWLFGYWSTLVFSLLMEVAEKTVQGLIRGKQCSSFDRKLHGMLEVMLYPNCSSEARNLKIWRNLLGFG